MFNVDKDVYVNGDIELSILHFEGYDRYWIKGSVGCIEFNQDSFDALLRLLVEYDKEVNKQTIPQRIRSKLNGR